MEVTNKSNIVSSILKHCENTPEKKAVIVLDNRANEIESATYRELNNKAQTIAGYFQQQSSMDERALLIFPTSVAFASSFFACLYSGVIAVPTVVPQDSSDWDNIKQILLDSDARFVLVADEYFERATSFFSQWGLEEAHRLMSYSELFEKSYQWICPDFSEEKIALLQYTSGSTSLPKGVVITHKNLIHNTELSLSFSNFNSKTVYGNWLPLNYDAGLIGAFFQSIYIGAQSVLFSPAVFLSRPVALLEAVTHYRINIIGGPNFLYQLLLDKVTDQDLSNLDLSSLQVAYSGGEMVRHEVQEKFVQRFSPYGFDKRNLSSCYGLAECTNLVTGTIFNDEPPVLKLSAGALKQQNVLPHGIVRIDDKPSSSVTDKDTAYIVTSGNTQHGMNMCIVDPTTLELVGSEKIGEIWISGPSLSQGYWRNDQDTKKTFGARLENDPTLYLRTGDMGFEYENQIYVTGRIKDLIIIRGKNYVPQDIELSVQKANSNLRADAVAAFTVDVDNEAKLCLVAEVESRDIDETTANKIFIDIREVILKEHAVDLYSISLIAPDTINKTSSGKIQRNFVSEKYSIGELDIVAQKYIESNPIAEETSVLIQDVDAMAGCICAIWCQVLDLNEVNPKSNFFDVGGHSLATVAIKNAIAMRTGHDISIIDLFAYPTAHSLARYIIEGQKDFSAEAISIKETYSQEPRIKNIAIIGMAGRFPDAPDLDQYWKNLCDEKESVRDHDVQDLIDNGFSDNILRNPHYVKAGIVLDDFDQFDAGFFGMHGRDAEVMDPQERILLMCCYEALENAGYPSEEYMDRIGVYVGKADNIYTRYNISGVSEFFEQYGGMNILAGNYKDFAATQISYKLGLTGPSVTLNSACSSSLVAIHQACLALRQGECNVALAGGVRVDITQPSGYIYSQGDILSPDGRCRAFSNDANGTILGSGSGVVVLKSLDQAIIDGDTVHAVIRGTAMNNDGDDKASYGAPSYSGQIKVITQALKNARVQPSSVQYVEAHGTGTAIGDPIEVAALTEVYGSENNPNYKCALGSVKTNIGHLESASGAASLIKTVLSLKNQKIPASINFSSPNKNIPFEKNVFYVNTQLSPWNVEHGPRRAGLSNYGVGGTNVHMIIEECPPSIDKKLDDNDSLVLLSGASPSALKTLIKKYLNFILHNPATSIRDIAYTTQVGRKPLRYRLGVVARNADNLHALLSAESLTETDSLTAAKNLNLAFVFNDLLEPKSLKEFFGEQYFHVKKSVHNILLEIRKYIIPLQSDDLDEDRVTALFEYWLTSSGDNLVLKAHLFNFVVKFSIAEVLTSAGVVPTNIISSGEDRFLAAFLCGALPLSVAVKAFLLTLQTVSEVEPSSFVLPSSKEIRREIASSWQGVKIPVDIVYSNKRASLTNIFSNHFVDELMNTCNAPDWYKAVFEEKSLEGKQIASIFFEQIKQQTSLFPERSYIFRENSIDSPSFLTGVGNAWVCGCNVDWNKFKAKERLHRIPLPSYPFETKKYWLEPNQENKNRIFNLGVKKYHPENTMPRYYASTWIRGATIRQHTQSNNAKRKKELAIVFCDDRGIANKFIHKIESCFNLVVKVYASEIYEVKDGFEYHIDSESFDDYIQCVKSLPLITENQSISVFHFWNIYETPLDEFPKECFSYAQKNGFLSILNFYKAIVAEEPEVCLELIVVTEPSIPVTGMEKVYPERHTCHALCKVLAQENERVKTRLIDIDLGGNIESKDFEEFASDVFQEWGSRSEDPVVALRSNKRWLPHYEPIKLSKRSEQYRGYLSKEKVYIILGGTGEIGLEIAKYLNEKYKAKLVLVGRRKIPESVDWSDETKIENFTAANKYKIEQLKELIKKEADFSLMYGDISNDGDLSRIFQQTKDTYGEIHGVIHSAVDFSKSIAGTRSLTAESFNEICKAKITGLYALDKVLTDYKVDFCLLMSSLSSVLGGVGLTAYTATNLFMDAMVQSGHLKFKGDWQIINWDAWELSGVTSTRSNENLEEYIPVRRGLQSLDDLMSWDIPQQIIVTVGDFKYRCQRWLNSVNSLVQSDKSTTDSAAKLVKLERPMLSTDYVKPQTSLEIDLIRQWENLLEVMVGLDDDFNELGGDSLMVTRIFTYVRNKYKKEIDLEKFYEEPTVSALVDQLELEGLLDEIVG